MKSPIRMNILLTCVAVISFTLGLYVANHGKVLSLVQEAHAGSNFCGSYTFPNIATIVCTSFDTIGTTTGGQRFNQSITVYFKGGHSLAATYKKSNSITLRMIK